MVSYFDSTNGDLKVARCMDVVCSTATKATVDAAGTAGLYSSATIGADGLGLVAYQDGTNDDLKVAHCSNVFCQPYFRRR